MSYVDDAIASGIPIEAINNFLANNPGDESRIMAALGASSFAPSGDSGPTSYQTTQAAMSNASNRQACLNMAIAAGIPQEAIQRWLAGNPGDECRIMSALGPDYGVAAGRTISINESQLQTAIASSPPELLASAGTDTLSEPFANPNMQPDSLGSILGKIGSVIVGTLPIPGAGALAGALGSITRGRLPSPVELPRLPSGTPPIIDIPATRGGTARTPRPISARTAAAIAAAAAALGIGVDEYVRRYGVPRAHHRRMNACNVRALGRAQRRMNAFECMAKKYLTFNAHTSVRTGHRKRSKAKSCARGCR